MAFILKEDKMEGVRERPHLVIYVILHQRIMVLRLKSKPITGRECSLGLGPVCLFASLFVCLFVFEIRSHCVAQASLRLLILLLS